MTETSAPAAPALFDTATVAAKPARKREKKVVEMADYISFARRILRATGRRVQDRDIEGLAGLAVLQAEINDQMKETAKALNAQGYSWAEIGRVLGVSKQAAQQRFGK